MKTINLAGILILINVLSVYPATATTCCSKLNCNTPIPYADINTACAFTLGNKASKKIYYYNRKCQSTPPTRNQMGYCNGCIIGC